MRKTKKSYFSMFLNDIANIFSIKGYSRRTRRTKSNYFKRNELQFMKKLPKWKSQEDMPCDWHKCKLVYKKY